MEDGIQNRTQELREQNKKLKKMLLQMRSPQKLCVDLLLVAIMLGIGAYIVQMVKPQARGGGRAGRSGDPRPPSLLAGPVRKRKLKRAPVPRRAQAMASAKTYVTETASNISNSVNDALKNTPVVGRRLAEEGRAGAPGGRRGASPSASSEEGGALPPRLPAPWPSLWSVTPAPRLAPAPAADGGHWEYYLQYPQLDLQPPQQLLPAPAYARPLR